MFLNEHWQYFMLFISYGKIAHKANCIKTSNKFQIKLIFNKRLKPVELIDTLKYRRENYSYY